MLKKELRVGVISDTHARALDELPDPLLTTLADVDLIVHAGDFTEKAVLDGLRNLGEVKAVLGNMDSGALRRVLPRHDLFTVGGKRVGLIHGWGVSWGLAERVKELFSDVDIIIFGHSHEPSNRYIGKTLLFNPGRARHSFGLLTIGEETRAEILKV